MNETKEFCVILPASGVGERMGLSEPKQFSIVRGKPLLCHTVDAFLSCLLVEKIVVTSPINSVSSVQDMLKKCMPRNSVAIVVTEGGTTRHRSIKMALQKLKSEGVTSEVVVIHDAVRPIVPIDILIKIIDSAFVHGSAGVTRPLVSTVISKDGDNFLTESLNRSLYFNSEMPQAFKFELINKVYDKCTENDLEYGTECLQLVLKYTKIRAKLIDGTPDLWKVTYKKDLHALDGVLAEQEIVHVVNCENKNLRKVLQNIIPLSFKEVKFVEVIPSKCVNCIKFYKDSSLVRVLDNTVLNSDKNNPDRQIHVIHGNNLSLSYNLSQLKVKAKTYSLKNAPALVNFIYILNTEEETEFIDLILTLLRNNLTGQIFYL